MLLNIMLRILFRFVMVSAAVFMFYEYFCYKSRQLGIFMISVILDIYCCKCAQDHFWFCQTQPKMSYALQ